MQQSTCFDEPGRCRDYGSLTLLALYRHLMRELTVTYLCLDFSTNHHLPPHREHLQHRQPWSNLPLHHPLQSITFPPNPQPKLPHTSPLPHHHLATDCLIRQAPGLSSESQPVGCCRKTTSKNLPPTRAREKKFLHACPSRSG